MNPTFVAGLAGFAIALLCAHGRSTPYDNYVLLASAWLHGTNAIAWPGPAIDAILVGLDRIVIEGPLPALLLVPFVAIFGPAGWTQTLLACGLCGVATGAGWELATRLGVGIVPKIYAVAFLLAGTDLLWCAMLGDVWFIAHVSAVAFTLLALVEIEGRKRGWLVALFAACAFESRFPLIVALVPYAWLLWDGNRRTLTRRFGGALAVLGAVACAHAAYDMARFGTPADVGFTIFYEQYEGQRQSMFRLANLPLQLHAFLLKAPIFAPVEPYIRFDIFGVALVWTSPALVLAFLARPFDRRVMAYWLATILTAGPALLYYDRGGAQFGMRHALDFEPFLFALIVVAARNGVPVWGRILVAYSAAVGILGVSYWNNVYRPWY